MFMEGSEINLNNINNFSELQELKKNIKELESTSPILFFREKGENIYKVFEIIIQMVKSYQECTIYDNLFKMTTVINWETSYLKNAFHKNNIVYLFIFFILNDGTKMDMESLLPSFDFENMRKNNLIHTITSFINDLNFIKPDLHIRQKSNYYSNFSNPEFVEEFAFTQISNKIEHSYISYDLLDAYKYKLIDNLISLLINIDFNYFLTFINEEQNPLKIIIIIKNLNENHLKDIMSYSKLTNKWLIFEIIYQICLKNNGMYDTVEKSVKLLFDIDTTFFINVKKLFLQNDMFNKAYAKLLSTLDTQNITSLWPSFNFNEYSNNHNINLFDNLQNTLDFDKFKLIVELTFEKYEEFFKWHLELKSEYIGLLITDYCIFIIEYYSIFYTDSQIIEKLLDLLEKIRYLNQEWFTNKTNMKRVNYLYLTKIYFLGFVYNRKNLKNSNIEDCIQILEKDYYLNKFINKNDLKYLKMIKDNFGA